MTRIGPYEVHPAADLYPLIEGEEFDQLVADIKKNGLIDPIILNHDRTMLIDGRNRYRACEVATVDPVFETLPARYTDLMIIDLIVSKNDRRRSMTAGQKAMVALGLVPLYAKAQPTGAPVGNRNASKPSPSVDSTVADLPPLNPPAPKSRDLAASKVGVSGRAVQQAKAVQRDTPDLAEKVRTGRMALDAADRERKKRVDEMKRREPPPKPTAATPTRPMLTLHTHVGEPVQYPEPQSRSTFNQSSGSGISWAEWSWNPVTGCLHGCTYCYAREIATNDRYKQAYPAGFTPLFHPERLDAPANTNIPAAHRDNPAWRRVFVCSMADLYGRWVPDEWIDKVHASMLRSPGWDYITLTKFPARYVGLDMPPRAWVGTSVDEQKRVRIAEDAFRQIDGVAVKWLSLEPLRERLEFTDLTMFDWVVIGAQTSTTQPSGPVPAVQPDWKWVVRITHQAMEAGCRVHWKPNLRSGPGMTWPDEYPDPAAGDSSTIT